MKNQNWIKYELNTWIEATSGFGNTLLIKKMVPHSYGDYLDYVICGADNVEHSFNLFIGNYPETHEDRDYFHIIHLKPNEKIKITHKEEPQDIYYDLF